MNNDPRGKCASLAEACALRGFTASVYYHGLHTFLFNFTNSVLVLLILEGPHFCSQEAFSILTIMLYGLAAIKSFIHSLHSPNLISKVYLVPISNSLLHHSCNEFVSCLAVHHDFLPTLHDHNGLIQS